MLLSTTKSYDRILKTNQPLNTSHDVFPRIALSGSPKYLPMSDFFFSDVSLEQDRFLQSFHPRFGRNLAASNIVVDFLSGTFPAAALQTPSPTHFLSVSIPHPSAACRIRSPSGLPAPTVPVSLRDVKGPARMAARPNLAICGARSLADDLNRTGSMVQENTCSARVTDMRGGESEEWGRK